MRRGLARSGLPAAAVAVAEAGAAAEGVAEAAVAVAGIATVNSLFFSSKPPREFLPWRFCFQDEQSGSIRGFK
jgi:hypothetical protein